MRCIFAGIEYAGKSTLIDLLARYYQRRGRRAHVDDHFSIPDSTLSPESRAAMVEFPNDVKERMQRMQINYHIEVIKNYENVLLGGWHLEEAIYSSVYGSDPDSAYYPNYWHGVQRIYETRVLEDRLPDIVLVHISASDEAIAARMRAQPHPYQIIKEKDIPDLKRRFEEEVEASLFCWGGRRIDLDTTDKTPQQSLDEVLERSEPLVTAGEAALRAIPVPDGDFTIRYRDGVREMVAV
jgi:hypothetical protein